jgi:hypothetical protein
MPYITLSVTTPVIQQVEGGNHFQRQLAIRDASPELLALIRQTTAQNRITVPICGVFKLSVGDIGAIWASHQNAGIQADGFFNLYSLLSRRPDVSVKFEW